MSQPERFEAKESPAALRAFVFAGVPFLLSLLAFSFFLDGFLRWLSLIGFVVVSASLALRVIRMRRASAQPDLIFDEVGIHDHRLGLSIPWADITKLNLFSGEAKGVGGSVLEVSLSDPARYKSKLSAYHRSLAASNRMARDADLFLNLTLFDEPPEEVAASAQAHLEYSRRYNPRLHADEGL